MQREPIDSAAFACTFMVRAFTNPRNLAFQPHSRWFGRPLPMPVVTANKLRDLFHLAGRVPDSTLPYDQGPPSELSEQKLLFVVPLGVTRQLGMPEILSGCRRGGIEAAGMAVPEAAMDMNDEPIFAQYQIRTAREILPVQSIPVPESEQEPPYRELW